MTMNETVAERPSENPLPAHRCNDPKRLGVGTYFLLFAVQTSGVVLLLSNLIPLYRLMAMDFAKYAPHPRIGWALVGILLVQGAYWLRVRLQPAMPRARSLLLGHLITFIARLSFVSVTAVFSTMFLQRFDALKSMDYPPLRALAVLLMFFTIFCWTLEIERLAKALQGVTDENKDANRN